MGDFNINTFNESQKLYGIHSSNFSNIFLSHGYHKMIDKPTRCILSKRQNNSSLIDNIYTNFSINMNCKAGIVMTDFSDHYSIFLILADVKVSKIENLKTIRRFCEKNKSKFNYCLNKNHWNDTYSHPNSRKFYFISQFILFYF